MINHSTSLSNEYVGLYSLEKVFRQHISLTVYHGCINIEQPQISVESEIENHLSNELGCHIEGVVMQTINSIP